MTEQEFQQLKYPIGKFDCRSNISREQIESWISILEHFPNRLEKLVSNLLDRQLDTPYRPNGWTIRQVVHHISDSHHHSYSRFKWTLTEDEMSLNHIKIVHFKLVYLLKTISDEDLNKYFIHPETNSKVTLKCNIGNYAWHSNHHYAHIENLLKRKGWL